MRTLWYKLALEWEGVGWTIWEDSLVSCCATPAICWRVRDSSISHYNSRKLRRTLSLLCNFSCCGIIIKVYRRHRATHVSSAHLTYVCDGTPLSARESETREVLSCVFILFAGQLERLHAFIFTMYHATTHALQFRRTFNILCIV